MADEQKTEEMKTNSTSDQKTILLVEDDQVLRNMYVQRLKMDGHNVLGASDGEEGFDVFKKEKIDLLITDIMLPRVSGTELLQKIRGTKKGKNLKAIAWSNLSLEDEKKQAESLGILEYIVKNTLTLDQLSETVKKYLS